MRLSNMCHLRGYVAHIFNHCNLLLQLHVRSALSNKKISFGLLVMSGILLAAACSISALS